MTRGAVILVVSDGVTSVAGLLFACILTLVFTTEKQVFITSALVFTIEKLVFINETLVFATQKLVFITKILVLTTKMLEFTTGVQ